MRSAFVKQLIALAAQDPRILLLTGDLGYSALEPFAEKFPDRFFNVGITEQNMMGMATGLAQAGYIPFVYTIAAFATLRPFEFIRNGPILHRLPVRIIGIGGGFEYGNNGLSHYALEDIGVMRTQRGIAVIVPADYQQAAAALMSTWEMPGPVYYRLGKDDKTIIPELYGRFRTGRCEMVVDGSDILIISTGNVALDVAGAVAALRSEGLAAAHMVAASISPAPIDDLESALRRHAVAMTVEAHSISGGLGSLVAEVIADKGLSCRLARCGVDEPYDGISGSRAFLHSKCGIDTQGLAQTARACCKRTRERAKD